MKTDPRRALAIDDLQAALRMLMVELETLAPRQTPAVLSFEMEAPETPVWMPHAQNGTGRVVT